VELTSLPVFALVVAILSAFASAQQAPEKKDPGQAAFARVCEGCHGAEARGGQGPALVPYNKELSDLVDIVRSGIGMMPAIPKSEISDEEIAHVHAYLKELTRR
jgi:mono/diheme cytochrome c family protein